MTKDSEELKKVGSSSNSKHFWMHKMTGFPGILNFAINRILIIGIRWWVVWLGATKSFHLRSSGDDALLKGGTNCWLKSLKMPMNQPIESFSSFSTAGFSSQKMLILPSHKLSRARTVVLLHWKKKRNMTFSDGYAFAMAQNDGTNTSLPFSI